MKKGEVIAEILQWAWECGLLIQLDMNRYFSAGFPESRFEDHNLNVQLRKREECWPVIKFSNPIMDRHQIVTARTFDELWVILEFSHKKIFAELGCPQLGKSAEGLK